MQQANWISLDIIVTHFACMVQRLASSMRPTKYASAASCRHIMVLPWKHKSYLPTSRSISWTSREKGSFLIRSSVLFWNCQISQRAAVPDWYFLVFWTLPAWRNSFWGALPPMVGWSFFLTGSSPEADGLTSAASGPTVRLVMMMVTYPHPPAALPPLHTSQPLPLPSPPLLRVRAFWLGMGGALGRGPPFLLCQLFSLFFQSECPPLSSIFLWHQFCFGHSTKQIDRSCSKPEISLPDSDN